MIVLAYCMSQSTLIDVCITYMGCCSCFCNLGKLGNPNIHQSHIWNSIFVYLHYTHITVVYSPQKCTNLIVLAYCMSHRTLIALCFNLVQVFAFVFVVLAK